MSMMSMSGPMGIASSVTGLPMKAKKKAVHRGRKPSGKPGASHLAKLQQAHSAGNLAEAKTHALNFAKAVHQAMQGTEPDADDSMTATNPEPAAPSMAPMSAPPKPMGNPRARLAQLAMSRKRPAI